MGNKDYIFGTRDVELDRLGFQHEVWSEDSKNIWKQAGIKKGDHVLDVGSGPGFTSFDLSEIVGPSGKITSFEKSEKFIEYLSNTCREKSINNIESVLIDLKEFKSENSKYDHAFSRWVFSWISDPEIIIKEICDSLKPGGTFIFQEYYNWHSLRVHPDNEAFNIIRQGAFESWNHNEGKINIGEDLTEILAGLGFEITFIKPICKIGTPGNKVWEWVTGFLKIYSELLIEKELITKDNLSYFIDELPKMESDPSTFLFGPQMIEIIAKKIS